MDENGRSFELNWRSTVFNKKRLSRFDISDGPVLGQKIVRFLPIGPSTFGFQTVHFKPFDRPFWHMTIHFNLLGPSALTEDRPLLT